ncbi:MAG: HAMP domain-containing sensor histidine kinase [Gemmatimonadota bacterium]
MKEMRKPTPPLSVAPPEGKPAGSDPRTEGARPGDQVGSRPRRQSRAPFRTRLFAILLLFALIPTIAVTLVWAGTASRALSMMSAGSAWERIAASGERAIAAARTAPLSPEGVRALDAHEAELRQSVELATRFNYVASRTMRLILVGALFVVVLVALGASRVAGHLSRQLSRPLDELVGWTGLIRTGRPIPEQTGRRGAPEFETLRSGMRNMAAELEVGRRRALEAERAEAFRESARRFAHELKNPLTPIRFAVERLRRTIPDELRETVDVLAEESARLETMARSFAQFGRLPDGTAAEIDVVELVTRTARSTVPERLALTIDAAPELPLVLGYHEPLVRAVANVLLNAVDACGPTGRIVVQVRPDSVNGQPGVCIVVRDSGCGVTPDVLARMFDPYVTTKPGGTGLGLAIAQQTVAAHRGVIEATSSVGAGTEMRLRIPITGVQEEQ